MAEFSGAMDKKAKTSIKKFKNMFGSKRKSEPIPTK
jgi:hypothetical protein